MTTTSLSLLKNKNGLISWYYSSEQVTDPAVLLTCLSHDSLGHSPPQTWRVKPFPRISLAGAGATRGDLRWLASQLQAPSCFPVTKWALWRRKPWWCRGAKGWLLHAELDENEASHINTHTTPTMKNTSANMPAHRTKILHSPWRQQQHTNPQLASMTLATQSHWVQFNVKKKTYFRS